MTWKGNKQKHALAAKGIKSKIHIPDNRTDNTIDVTWKQENNDGAMIEITKEFVNKKAAEKHIERIKYSASVINKPLEIVRVGKKDENKKQNV